MPRFFKGEKGVLVQGITGREGRFHTTRMLAYGTNIVGGVTPGRGGEWLDLGDQKVPVFDTIQSAVAMTGAEYAINFVPAGQAPSSLREALDAHLEVVVSHTRGIAVREMLALMDEASHNGTTILGPACAGVLIPGAAQLGVIPGDFSLAGNTGIISTSGALVFEVLNTLTAVGIGQSLVIDIGAERVKGLTMRDSLAILEEEPDTDRILLIGTPLGEDEIEAARFIMDSMTKPVTAYLAGLEFLEAQGAGGPMQAYAEQVIHKRDTLSSVGVRVVKNLDEMLKTLG